jgi:uncharacterized membrane protein
MQNGDKLFGKVDNILVPFVFLLLFSLSAATVGSLTLGLPVLMFFDGKKTDSIKAAIYSIGWLGLYTLVGLVILFVVNNLSTLS